MSPEQGKTLPPGEAWYRGVFDRLPFPTLVLDPQMRVSAANQAFLKLYDRQRDDVVGLPCYQVFHHRNEPCEAGRCRFDEAMAGREGSVILHEHRNPAGTLYEEIHLAPLLDGEGQVVGVIESLRDVTVAKRLEASLKQTNEFLNRLLDSLVGVVIAADLSGRILFVNKSWERVLGYSVAEAMEGMTLWDIAPPEDLSRIRRVLEEGHGRALGFRSQVIRKDGECIPVRVNSAYVYRDGVPVATVGIMTDLREWLKLEDNLVQARLQVVHSEKLARLGRMAAGIAHELNNPLTGITVYAELLKETLGADEGAQTDLDYIIEDAERCREIIRGLLDYSRQGEVRVEELDLTAMVEDAFELIRDNTVFLHVEVVKEYAAEPLLIQGDKKLLRQVFINLLMNAVDAMEGRGRLTVKTGLCEDGWRCVEISDTGPGITPENLRRIFDPFFTTKEVGKGTGLGLSVVFGVVTRHGGTIEVKKSGPEGTTFLVRMPATAPSELRAIAGSYRPLE